MNGIILTATETQYVAEAALLALSRCNLKACLIGSMAAVVFGIEHRKPKDVDLLVLNAASDQNIEQIKELIVNKDENFVLINSRIVGATHRVLWYNLDRAPCSESNQKRFCKVDVLTPYELHMGQIPESELYTDPSSTFLASVDSENLTTLASIPIPYVPVNTLLMLKLRAWIDHSEPFAPENMHARIPQDEDDIQEILRVGILKEDLSVARHRGVADEECWALGGFSDWAAASRAVRKFVKKWPLTAASWRAVGFV